MTMTMTMTMTPGKPYFRFITYQGPVNGNWVIATSDDRFIVFVGSEPVHDETLEALQNQLDMLGYISESLDEFLLRFGVGPREQP